MKNIHVMSQNIYITSNEEITGFEDNIWVIKGERIFFWQNIMALVSNNKPKKIILTTDQDLIKDGVQVIPDEFLEWFCKNSSCEEVGFSTYHFKGGIGGKLHYKIIIPKEEPKYPIGGYAPGYYMCNCSTCKKQFQGDKRAVQCEPCAIEMIKEEPRQELPGINRQTFKIVLDEKWFPKQETLEEAAERLNPYVLNGKTPFKEGFRECAKWQQERSYSEEEVYNITQQLRLKLKTGVLKWQDDFEFDLEKWFEQFKKK